MAEATKKRNKVFDYFVQDDPFAGGVAWCAGCPLELTARFVPQVLGKNMIFVGTPGCAAAVLAPGEFDISDQWGTSSRVFIANQ